MISKSPKLTAWRIFLVGLAIVFAIVAEYQNSLQWYFFQSGQFTPIEQLDRLEIDMQRGWLRSKWNSGSMYFEKVDLFGSDRIIGSFLITDDPKQVQELTDSHTFTTTRQYTWGEALLNENEMVETTRPPTIPMIVPSLGIRIATNQPELLAEIVKLRRKP